MAADARCDVVDNLTFLNPYFNILFFYKNTKFFLAIEFVISVFLSINKLKETLSYKNTTIFVSRLMLFVLITHGSKLFSYSIQTLKTGLNNNNK